MPATSPKAKLLGDPTLLAARRQPLDNDAMRLLREFVDSILRETDLDVQDFDPCDGGIDAVCLFILEAPGSRAVGTGFVSRDNPDETAKNWLLFNVEADIDRARVAMWNIIPWYIGDRSRIRRVTSLDLAAGLPHLQRLIPLFHKLRMIVFVGCQAARARKHVSKWFPDHAIFEVTHPSPSNLNRSPKNRERFRRGLDEVRSALVV
jgi:uracil-DNA glycosylase